MPVSSVKHLLAEARGFYAVLERNRPAQACVGYFLARSFVATTRAACGLWTRVVVGILNAWYASAFTRGNDLPRNAQTLFGCQCAKNDYRRLFFLSGFRPDAFLTPCLKPGGCERSMFIPFSRCSPRAPQPRSWSLLGVLPCCRKRPFVATARRQSPVIIVAPTHGQRLYPQQTNPIPHLVLL